MSDEEDDCDDANDQQHEPQHCRVADRAKSDDQGSHGDGACDEAAEVERGVV